MKYIYVVADVNDGDYIRQFEPLNCPNYEYDLEEEGFKILVTEDDIINLLYRFKKAIEGFKPYTVEYEDKRASPSSLRSNNKRTWTHGLNFNVDPRKDLGEKELEEIYPEFTEFEWELIYDYFVPFMDNECVHTIVEVKLLEVEELNLEDYG